MTSGWRKPCVHNNESNDVVNYDSYDIDPVEKKKERKKKISPVNIGDRTPLVFGSVKGPQNSKKFSMSALFFGFFFWFFFFFPS